MTQAWIDGRPVSSGEAVREAARLLSGSRLPLVTGDFEDVSALREAARLAGACGGVLDHRDTAAIAPLLEAFRDNGVVRITPGEARRRATRVLVLGTDPFAGAPDLFEQIFSVGPDLGRTGEREIVLLGAHDAGRFGRATGSVRTVACPEAKLGEAIGILRAALAGRPFRDGPFEDGAARALAGWLKDAGFAVVMFDASALDALAIEGLADFVSDLNDHTRASALPILVSSAMGAAEAALWTTGFPLRVSFARHDPEHDMVLNDGARLASSGECDASLLVALDESGTATAPTILLSASEGPGIETAKVAFRIGRPGIDHAAVRFEPRFAEFVTVSAETSGMPANAADILSAIADHLDADVSTNDGGPR